MSATTYGWLVLAFPLAGTLLIALGWRVLPGKTPGFIGSAAIGLSFLASIGALLDLEDQPEDARVLVDSAYTYASTAGFHADLAILVDPLSVFMCLVVSGVSFLIHVYSVAYMSGDRGYARFFAYLNFFVFSMLLLVLAANFLLLIVGWAFVGAASYLLISFWYRRDTATAAGIKAFVINVIGDVGLVVGGVPDLRQDGLARLPGRVRGPRRRLHGERRHARGGLPPHPRGRVREVGPAPAAHLARGRDGGPHPRLRPDPRGHDGHRRRLPDRAHAPALRARPGRRGRERDHRHATLVFAATVALTVTDLKRVIAYSTISQIGYMVLGVSVAAYGAGMFHLMTHAFFKALLFMCAGSVIAAMAGNQNLDDISGFRKAMPFTFAAFVVGALALAGFPLMSGFFSKDEILAYTINRGGFFVALGVIAYLAAGLTAFYAFRLVFRIFLGEPVPEAREMEAGGLAHHDPENPLTGEKEDTDVGFPGPEHHVAERAGAMRAAMIPLAILSVVAGALAVPGITQRDRALPRADVRGLALHP